MSYPTLTPSTLETLWDGYQKPTGDIVIPQTVEYNGTSYPVCEFSRAAFAFCDGVNSVTLPEGVIIIENTAFWKCTHLQSVSLPSTLETIEKNVFCYDAMLTEITIPKNVKTIGNSALRGCIRLASTTPPSVLETTFSAYDATLYVPAGTVDAYRQHPVWGLFANIVEGTYAGIHETVTQNAVNGVWYDLNDRQFSAKPSDKGIYIYNGKKLIITTEP